MTESSNADSSEYAKSGVSSRGAEDALSGILGHVLPTREFNPRNPLVADIGYFANVMDIGNGMGLAFGTDGVGSKIIVAELMDRYDSIGIDCVAMNVNDVICIGARPISMVDYIACSHTDPEIFTALGKGLAEGARQADIHISGGEISQIREIIKGVDLVGACVGLVPIDRINIGKDVAPGDLIVGLASTGVHSNGLSLARRVLLGEDPTKQKEQARRFEERLGTTVGDELLKPTQIYVKPIMEMLDSNLRMKAMAHITSGGFGNLNRVAADNIRFVIDPVPPRSPVFDYIQDCAEIEDAEMFEVFNMGVGFCVVVEGASDVEQVNAICKRHGIDSWVIGQVEAAVGKEVTIPAHGLICKGQTFTKI
ncbi:MAG: phosphoribosylformylglycinamidine cyclo-ligase [Candidatus Nitrohelix vancouverensis]|uniref:Phosphoribosylformylglycinamidine cyclo-ligase n=1 Tax=Candidatus Nitrohelix vancouverensis TaxID=2705534 RepID=A0A7T0G2X3_9BACT|nr:MAG: phosphoribosylformylglycinamidine cyclo-ligase [Candidatus Nitrohelix vancouverensis]